MTRKKLITIKTHICNKQRKPDNVQIPKRKKNSVSLILTQSSEFFLNFLVLEISFFQNIIKTQ